jgi:methyl-accepting chemotaxis protein
MNNTSNELAHNAENAVQKLGESINKMSELSEAASAIGKVVETITEISQQVNLLSLNASIEAARAGDTG